MAGADNCIGVSIFTLSAVILKSSHLAVCGEAGVCVIDGNVHVGMLPVFLRSLDLFLIKGNGYAAVGFLLDFAAPIVVIAVVCKSRHCKQADHANYSQRN